mmetsp:Transcript_11722/g.30342  ORF Transcript_11722/g.30342 Transcript_11722/m.30342 type:complete len:208 (+) Transcript_11722:801-1424(+)
MANFETFLDFSARVRLGRSEGPAAGLVCAKGTPMWRPALSCLVLPCLHLGGLLGGVSEVGSRLQLEELLLFFLWDIQLLGKASHHLLGHRLAPGELLELLVGLLHPALAHDRLHRLRQNLPRVVNVTRDHRLVHLKLPNALEDGSVSQHRVSKDQAHVPEDSRVREVSLPPRDGQLGAQVLRQRVGHAEVALAVLKVDRVHLMGHRG